MFWVMIAMLVVAAWLVAPSRELAMWFGFALAGYSAVANDSIQTLGTFLASQRKVPWWVLWLFIGGIMAALHVWGWWHDGGDMAFGLLKKIPEADGFSFLLLAAPITLLVLTQLKIPVSTSILLLSIFSNKGTMISIIQKSAGGYLTGAILAFVVWLVLKRILDKYPNYNERLWRPIQWLSTAFLWGSWIMQDTANVAVFLPRSLTFSEMSLAVGTLFLLLGLLMYLKGGRIQSVVLEKTKTTDVREATVIDFAYAVILTVFKGMSLIPMSTTWCFVGLLAGREFSLAASAGVGWKNALSLSAWDFARIMFGLTVSVGLAWLIKNV